MYPIGRLVEEIETPALLLDLDKFQWNIDKMFKFAKDVGVNVRPHAKTFKAATIGNKLLEAGAIGLMTRNYPRQKPSCTQAFYMEKKTY